mmetsp:Transcript_40541/g.65909  ORF Transcript_40541/g.65909 Transcript_40541/m.65909 type:complete len:99 (+) Transcript_40541:320-616(+)
MKAQTYRTKCDIVTFEFAMNMSVFPSFYQCMLTTAVAGGGLLMNDGKCWHISSYVPHDDNESMLLKSWRCSYRMLIQRLIIFSDAFYMMSLCIHSIHC